MQIPQNQQFRIIRLLMLEDEETQGIQKNELHNKKTLTQVSSLQQYYESLKNIPYFTTSLKHQLLKLDSLIQDHLKIEKKNIKRLSLSVNPNSAEKLYNRLREKQSLISSNNQHQNQKQQYYVEVTKQYSQDYLDSIQAVSPNKIKKQQNQVTKKDINKCLFLQVILILLKKGQATINEQTTIELIIERIINILTSNRVRFQQNEIIKIVSEDKQQTQQNSYLQMRELYFAILNKIIKHTNCKILFNLLKMVLTFFNYFKCTLKEIQIVFQIVIKSQFKIKCVFKLSQFIALIYGFYKEVPEQCNNNLFFIVAALKMLCQKQIPNNHNQPSVNMRNMMTIQPYELIFRKKILDLNYTLFTKLSEQQTFLLENIFRYILQIYMQKGQDSQQALKVLKILAKIRITISMVKSLLKKLEQKDKFYSEMKTQQKQRMLDLSPSKMDSIIEEQKQVTSFYFDEIFNLLSYLLKLYPRDFDCVKFKHHSSNLRRKNKVVQPSVIQLSLRTHLFIEEEEYLLIIFIGEQNQYWLTIKQQEKNVNLYIMQFHSGIMWKRYKLSKVQWFSLWKNYIYIEISKKSINIRVNSKQKINKFSSKYKKMAEQYSQILENMQLQQEESDLSVKLDEHIVEIVIGGACKHTIIDQLYEFNYYPNCNLEKFVSIINESATNSSYRKHSLQKNSQNINKQHIKINLLKYPNIPSLKQLKEQSQIYLNSQTLYIYRESFITIFQSLGGVDLFFLIISYILRIQPQIPENFQQKNEQLSYRASLFITKLKKFFKFFLNFMQKGMLVTKQLTPIQRKQRKDKILCLCWLISKEFAKDGGIIIPEMIKLLGIRGGGKNKSIQITQALDVLCNFSIWKYLDLNSQEIILSKLGQILTGSLKFSEGTRQISIRNCRYINFSLKSFYDIGFDFCKRILLQMIIFYPLREDSLIQCKFFHLIQKYVCMLTNFNQKLFEFIDLLLRILKEISKEKQRLANEFICYQLSYLIKQCCKHLFELYLKYKSSLSNVQLSEKIFTCEQIYQLSIKNIKKKVNSLSTQLIKSQKLLRVIQIASFIINDCPDEQHDIQIFRYEGDNIIEITANFDEYQSNLSEAIVYLESLNLSHYKYLIYTMPIPMYTKFIYAAIFKIHIFPNNCEHLFQIFTSDNFSMVQISQELIKQIIYFFVNNNKRKRSQLGIIPLLMRKLQKDSIIQIINKLISDKKQVVKMENQHLNSKIKDYFKPQQNEKDEGLLNQEWFLAQLKRCEIQNKKIQQNKSKINKNYSQSIIFSCQQSEIFSTKSNKDKQQNIILTNNILLLLTISNVRYGQFLRINGKQIIYNWENFYMLNYLLVLKQLLWWNKQMSKFTSKKQQTHKIHKPRKLSQNKAQTNERKESIQLQEFNYPDLIFAENQLVKQLLIYPQRDLKNQTIKQVFNCPDNDIPLHRQNIKINCLCLVQHFQKIWNKKIQESRITQEEEKDLSQSSQIKSENFYQLQKLKKTNKIMNQFSHLLQFQLVPLVHHSIFTTVHSQYCSNKQSFCYLRHQREQINNQFLEDQKIMKDFITERRKSLIDVEHIWEKIQKNNYYFYKLFCKKQFQYKLDNFSTKLKAHPFLRVQAKKPNFQLPRFTNNSTLISIASIVEDAKQIEDLQDASQTSSLFQQTPYSSNLSDSKYSTSSSACNILCSSRAKNESIEDEQIKKDKKEDKNQFKVFWITISKIYFGTLTLRQNYVIFEQKLCKKQSRYDAICAHPQQRRTEEDIQKKKEHFIIVINHQSTIIKKKYLFFDGGIQIYCPYNCATYFFCFTGKAYTNRQRFFNFYLEQHKKSNGTYKKLLRKNQTTFYSNKKSKYSNQNLAHHYCRLWKNGLLTNFQYLMRINDCAGRSFNDLSQYYVFPWTYVQFNEACFENQQNYRPLNLPMGKVNKERWNMIKSRFQTNKSNYCSEPKNLFTEQFLYGTFYSNSAIVSGYLLRVRPFSQMQYRLQSNRFDIADRLFYSIEDQYKSSTSLNMGDVKQLIPEFYYNFEFLHNRNHYNLGIKQDKQKINDVILPKWGLTRQKFIFNMRQGLQHEITTEKINNWIDLVFGYKNKKQNRLKYDNLFSATVYEQSLSFSKKSQQEKNKKQSIKFSILNEQRQSTAIYFKQFGQSPQCLFQQPHPKNSSNGQCWLYNWSSNYISTIKLLNIQTDKKLNKKKQQNNKFERQSPVKNLFIKNKKVSFEYYVPEGKQNLLFEAILCGENIYIFQLFKTQKNKMTIINLKQRKQIKKQQHKSPEIKRGLQSKINIMQSFFKNPKEQKQHAKQKKKLNSSIVASVHSQNMCDDEDDNQYQYKKYVKDFQTDSKPTFKKPKKQQSQSHKILNALENLKQMSFRQFTLMKLVAEKSGKACLNDVIFYLKNGKSFFRQIKDNIVGDQQHIFIEGHSFQFIRKCNNHLILANHSNIYFYSQPIIKLNKQIIELIPNYSTIFKNTPNGEYSFNILPEFTQHQFPITNLQVSENLSIVVSVDKINRLFILNLTKQIFVRESFILKDLYVLEVIQKLIIHELGLLILFTSLNRILVYNLFGELIVKSYIQIKQTNLKRQKITDVCLLSQQAADLVQFLDNLDFQHIMWQSFQDQYFLAKTSQYYIINKQIRKDKYRYIRTNCDDKKSKHRQALAVNSNDKQSGTIHKLSPFLQNFIIQR